MKECVVVVGGGIVGSWTALHLARAGRAPLLLDQFALPHSRGSSHGQSRVFRAVGERDVGNIERAERLWRQLELDTGKTLLLTTGRLVIGEEGSEKMRRWQDEYAAVARPLSCRQLKDEYPQLDFANHCALYEPGAGVLLASRCVDAAQSEIRKHGGTIKDGPGAKVEAINVGRGEQMPVQLRLADGSVIEADKAVICAGSWAEQLLSTLKLPLRTEAIAVCYWREKEPGIHALKHGFPSFSHGTGEYHIYGTPSYEYEGLMKILHHGGPRAAADGRDQTDQSEHVRALSQYVRSHFKQLHWEAPALVEKCMYTWTADGQPVIDKHPADDGVVIGVGFSGGGFKWSPVAGEMLANLVLDKPNHLDISPYRIDRFR